MYGSEKVKYKTNDGTQPSLVGIHHVQRQILFQGA